MTHDSHRHKIDGPPPKDKMHNIGTTEARESKQRNVEDGLRLSVTVQKWARSAMRIGANDKIWVRAKANGSDIDYVAKLHSNGRSFTLPKEKRQSLGLDVGDEVQFWVAEYEEPNNNQVASNSGNVQEKQDVESKEDEETLLRFDPPIDAFYHIKDGNTTICGESLSERDTVEISDPGDALAPCPQCNIKSPDKMSNEQIVDYLAEKAGFDYSKSNPSYFSKSQLVSLLNYVTELEESKGG